MKNYGAKIAELRTERKMTQAELGAMLNVTSQAVSKWENGLSEPDIESIRKLCEIFEITFDEFFGVEPKAEEEKPEQKSEAQNGGVVLAYCDVCDKALYNPKEYQVSIENGVQHTTCLSCVPKKEAAKRLQALKAEETKRAARRSYEQSEARKELKNGLLWGILGAVGLALIALLFTYFGQDSTTIIIVGTVLGAFGGYAIVSQSVWGGSVIDVFLFFLRSFKLPGVIFTLDLDGIIFLILVKVIGGFLCALLSFFLFLIGLVVTSVYAIVIFPFALIKQIHEVRSIN